MPMIAQTAGQLSRLAGGEVDHEQLLRTIVEVSLAIDLELETRGLDRRGGFGLVAHGAADLGDHDGAFAVGREIEIADATRDVRDAAIAAAARRHAPQLRGLILVAGVAEVVNGLAVAREARLRLIGFGGSCELLRSAAVPGDGPQIAGGLVGFPVAA